mmetsp:Transcript_99665/g.121884  ORF Transcript_99665/g.121884 Transcript_99665/m.121884 type:complete len:234 (+) Transcript_99665:65-766(+)
MLCCCTEDGSQGTEMAIAAPSATDEAVAKVFSKVKSTPPATIKEEEEADQEAPAFGSFVVNVPMGGQKLGLEMDTTAAAKAQGGLMVKGIQAGAVQAFNERFPKQAIKIYDNVMKVDEVSTTKEMKAKISSSSPPETMKISLDRPRAVQVTLVKPGMLGVKLDFKANSAGCVVEELMSEGLVTTWNAYQPESDRVRRGDRIVEINGKAYEGAQMMEVLKKEFRLELTVLKFSS